MAGRRRAKRSSQITFGLHPELQFEYAIADDKHMTHARLVEEMDCVELVRWQAYFDRKIRKEKQAAARARARRKR